MLQPGATASISPKIRPTADQSNVNPERSGTPSSPAFLRHNYRPLWSDYTHWGTNPRATPQSLPVSLTAMRLTNIEDLNKISIIADYEHDEDGIAVAEMFSGKSSIIGTGLGPHPRIGGSPSPSPRPGQHDHLPHGQLIARRGRSITSPIEWGATPPNAASSPAPSRPRLQLPLGMATHHAAQHETRTRQHRRWSTTPANSSAGVTPSAGPSGTPPPARRALHQPHRYRRILLPHSRRQNCRPQQIRKHPENPARNENHRQRRQQPRPSPQVKPQQSNPHPGQRALPTSRSNTPAPSSW